MQAQYETRLIYRELDENGDYVYGGGMNDFLSARQAMRQVIQTRLAAIAGGWWEGDRTAIPYYTEVRGAPGGDQRRRAIDLMVISRLLDTVCVLKVTDFQSSYENRKYQATCNVLTVYGNIAAEVTI